MPTSLYQNWCATRLSALCEINGKFVAEAKTLMCDEGIFHACVPGEATIVHDLACRHQQKLCGITKALSVFLGVDQECVISVSYPTNTLKVGSQQIGGLSLLCELRATIATAEFAYDEVGQAFCLLELNTYSEDLLWMRDECAAYNRRLQRLVREYQAKMAKSTGVH